MRHVVPVILSYMHDNPEGRDVLALWTNNRTDQLCCLCRTPAADLHDWQSTLNSEAKYMAQCTAWRLELTEAAAAAAVLLVARKKSPADYWKCVAIAMGYPCIKCSSMFHISLIYSGAFTSYVHIKLVYGKAPRTELDVYRQSLQCSVLFHLSAHVFLSS